MRALGLFKARPHERADVLCLCPLMVAKGDFLFAFGPVERIFQSLPLECSFVGVIASGPSGF